MAKHLVIDLVPLLPGGTNGGAKIVALNLLQGLKQHILDDPKWRITVLTAPWNHAEIEQYEGYQVTCKMLTLLTQDHCSIRNIFKKIAYKISHIPIFSSLLDQLQGDLLFCPFSNPSLSTTSTPVISILHDLQNWQHPNFFSSRELKHRNQYLKRMINHVDCIVCVSHFSERSLYNYCDTVQLSPKTTKVIYNYFSSPILGFDIDQHQNQENNLNDFSSLSNQKALISTPYLLYPANYWPHKNHRLLLQAYAHYIQWYSDESPNAPLLDLVFTGALESEEDQIKALARQFKIRNKIHFLGYLDHQSFENIWFNTAGLLFPSLYEGFGLPIVEAMERSKPILCSQIPSLEEVTEGACLYFNPSEVESIFSALQAFTVNPKLRAELSQKSRIRFQFFKNLNPIHEYLNLFSEVLECREN